MCMCDERGFVVDLDADWQVKFDCDDPKGWHCTRSRDRMGLTA